ncbi:MAG TPA: hypothetical protein VD793_00285 [Gemmatimonadales bacterium]|nr:hypothetical protein [Gemmatimonadales bacterium]
MAQQAIPIEEAQARLTPQVMRLPGVTGIGIGRCGKKPCLKVYVVARTDALAAQIPRTYEGYVVDLQVSGELRALDPR